MRYQFGAEFSGDHARRVYLIGIVSLAFAGCGGGSSEADSVEAANTDLDSMFALFESTQEATINSYIRTATQQIIASGGRVNGVIGPMTASYYIELCCIGVW